MLLLLASLSVASPFSNIIVFPFFARSNDIIDAEAPESASASTLISTCWLAVFQAGFLAVLIVVL